MSTPKIGNRWTLGLTVLFVPLLFAFSGCGSKFSLSDVSGVVTLNGAPVTGAGVRFTPLSGDRSSSGQTDGDGNYRLIFSPTEVGAITGEHEVLVQHSGKLLSKSVTVESGSPTINLELSEFEAAARK